ncbi:MAG: peptide deformylase [Lentibacter algarum]|uniref:peptide deformylase n=1 Tax=Lentibacter algarum TaxID=576131 RepID=UPI0026EB41A9|nr:peptide deformylase [Lentibacter algarum]
MSVLPIVQWPDPRLSTVCAPVDAPTCETLLNDMFDTMYAAKGRGLAGPQVGVLERLFVMDAGWKEGTPTPLVMINPEIEPCGEPASLEEMCLSVPDVGVPVLRPSSVFVRWHDEHGAPQAAQFGGAEARIIQHEFDHLDGKLHFDRVSPDLRTDLETPYLKAHT